MAFNGSYWLILLAVVAAMGTGAAAMEVDQLYPAAGEPDPYFTQAADLDPRLLFSTNTSSISLGTITSQSITLGIEYAVLVSVLLAGLLAATIVLGILLGIETKDEKSYDYAGTSYASAPSYATAPATYEESTYAIHRSLDTAEKKYSNKQ